MLETHESALHVTEGALAPAPALSTEQHQTRPRLIRERRAMRLLVLIFLASWGWFAVHFFFTAMYLLPLNGLTARLYPVASAYILPRFRQHWALFAPDPDGKTKHFQFRCRLEDKDGVVTDSQMYNVSEEFYANTWRTRLGPGQRLHRAYMMPLGMLSKVRAKWLHAHMYLAQGRPEAIKELEEKLAQLADAKAKRSREIAGRIAAIACRRQFPGEKIVQAYAVVDIVQPRSFHQRTELDIPVDAVRVEFGWHEVKAGTVRL